MNRIDTSYIVDPTKLMYINGPMIDFLQDAVKDLVQACAAGSFPQDFSLTTGGFVLYGVDRSGSSATIPAGYIYVNGEIYYFAGIGNYNTFSNTGVFVLADSADPVSNPVYYTDGSTENANRRRRLNLVDQLNGTGLCDYSSLTFAKVPWLTPSLLNSWSAANPIRYNKKDGFVRISGVANNLTVANAALPLFTLPAGYRPSYFTYVPVSVENNGSRYVRQLEITSAGNVSIDTTGFANVLTTVWLNGVHFNLIF